MLLAKKMYSVRPLTENAQKFLTTSYIFRNLIKTLLNCRAPRNCIYIYWPPKGKYVGPPLQMDVVDVYLMDHNDDFASF